MSNIDQKIRILWFSDIHYQINYTNKNEILKKFIASFIEKVSSLNSDAPFDYVIISGDIAQSGEKYEYSLFIKDILLPMQKEIPNAKLIVIPGNHDVARGSAEFINPFIESLPNNRNKFLKENFNSYFTPIFNNFSNAFSENAKIPDKNSNLIDNNLLFGYILDKRKKIIFIIINTAWFSIGDKFLENYLVTILNPNKKTFKRLGDKSESPRKSIKKTDDLKSKIKNIKDIANEYGKQLTGFNILPKDQIDPILKILNEYGDYVITTIMHHPLNWLDWDDRINYHPDSSNVDDKKGNPFHKIRENTDILLTGHEHVHELQKSEKINDNRLLHLEAGCFLEASYDNKEFEVNNNCNNWFSTLDINSIKKTVKQKRYTYNHLSGWKDTQDNKPINLTKKYHFKISEKRYKDISKNLKNNNFDQLIYLRKKHKQSKISKINDLYFGYLKNIYTFIADNDTSKIDVNSLKLLIREKEIDVICFYFIDFHNIKSKQYIHNMGNERDNLSILNHIKDDCDFSFDTFRYNFFKNLNDDDITSFKDLKLISKIIPYWVLESYIKP